MSWIGLLLLFGISVYARGTLMSYIWDGVNIIPFGARLTFRDIGMGGFDWSNVCTALQKS